MALLSSLFLSAFICVHLRFPSLAIAEEAPGIAWRSFEDAVAESVASERVMVVYFTADWCGWCRKMETATLGDSRVIDLASRFTWAKVDIDAQPEIASRFNVRGVPTTVLVNARGEFLAGRPGYAPADDFLKLLAQNRDKATAPGAARERLLEDAGALAAVLDAETQEAMAQAVSQALTLLARSERRQREPLVQAIVAAGRRAWPALVDSLASEELAIRAAASELLRQSAASGPAFDPFAESTTRDEQIGAWRSWLAEQTEAQPAAESSGS